MKGSNVRGRMLTTANFQALRLHMKPLNQAFLLLFLNIRKSCARPATTQ